MEEFNGENEDENYLVKHDQIFVPDRYLPIGDGDYPPFLEPEQQKFLPHDFCRKYGTFEISFISGGWYEFPLERIEEMKADLERAGFCVHVQIDGNNAEAESGPLVSAEPTVFTSVPEPLMVQGKPRLSCMPERVVFSRPLCSTQIRPSPWPFTTPI